MPKKNDTDINDYISAIAPNGEYTKNNTKNGTVGRYGFSWATHAPDIQKVTGIKSKSDFINNPEAQDKYFKWHVENNLQPAIGRISSLNKAGLDDGQLANLVHNKGEGGAKKWLQANTSNTSTPVKNTPVSTDDRLKEVKQDMSPITSDERDKWEAMQGEAYTQQFKGNDSKAAWSDFMKAHGVDPSRFDAYQQDFIQNKAGIPKGSSPTVSPKVADYSPSDYFYGDKTLANERYMTYAVKLGDQPEQNFGTNQQAALAKLNTHKETENKGLGDTTQNVNNVPQPAANTPIPPAIADPRFPTRDPITGVVTPAKIQGPQPVANTPAPPAATDPRFPTRDPITGRVTPAVQQPVVQQPAAPSPQTTVASVQQPAQDLKMEDLQKLPKSTQIEIFDKFHGPDQEGEEE